MPAQVASSSLILKLLLRLRFILKEFEEREETGKCEQVDSDWTCRNSSLVKLRSLGTITRLVCEIYPFRIDASEVRSNSVLQRVINQLNKYLKWFLENVIFKLFLNVSELMCLIKSARRQIEFLACSTCWNTLCFSFLSKLLWQGNFPILESSSPPPSHFERSRHQSWFWGDIWGISGLFGEVC